MKNKFLFSLVFFCLLSISVLGQRNLGGTVIQIVDGRTIVVQDKPNSRLSVRLQAIEVPDEKQQLSSIVKEHLGKLLLGKLVKVQMNGITIGKVTVDGIDISGQMLRDGAAWYDLPEKNSHNQIDRDAYLSLENAAKTEKRGVWGVAGLKPSWEFRAEQQKILEEQRLAEEAERAKTTISKPRLSAEERALKASESVQFWAETPTADKKPSPKRPIKTDDSDENEITVSVDSGQNLRNPATEKAEAVAQEMQYLLQRLVGEGVSLTSFQSSLGNLKVKVALASDNLPPGKLKSLMTNNVEILSDLEHAISFMDKSQINTLYYRGEVVTFAKKYLIEPVRLSSGHFAITKQDILNALVDKALKNFVQMKKILDS